MRTVNPCNRKPTTRNLQQETRQKETRQEAKAINKVLKEVPKEALLSRRRFVAGVAGAGIAAATAGMGALSACAPSRQDELEKLVSQPVPDKDIVTIEVEPEQLLETSSFDDAPFDDYLKLEATWEIPYGSLLYQIDAAYALALIPGGEGESLRKIAVLDLDTGELTVVCERSVGAGKNVVLYDARASRTRLIWVEVDLGNHTWRTYVAPLFGLVAGEARMVEEGDGDWEPPQLAVCDDKVYWTVMPVATGPANQEDSQLKALGAVTEPSGQNTGLSAVPGTPYTVLVSHGRMITNPLVASGMVTFVPRLDTDNVYYQLAAFNCADDKPVDVLILPQSVRVTDALYMDGSFTFCIEVNYDYAKGLKSFGTYQQLEEGMYLHINRPPVCAPVRMKDFLIVKSTVSVVGIDVANHRSFVIDLPPRCSEFGEALVGWGIRDKLVTYSIRMGESGEGPETTLVRVFGPADKPTQANSPVQEGDN